jgi:hypothetical protein
VDRHALITEDVLQSISSYETILMRVRTVSRLVQDRIRHTITEYELPLPQEADATEQSMDYYRD